MRGRSMAHGKISPPPGLPPGKIHPHPHRGHSRTIAVSAVFIGDYGCDEAHGPPGTVAALVSRMDEQNHPDSDVTVVDGDVTTIDAPEETRGHDFLYYHHDSESGRITLTGFVSASSRRDARRRLRQMGLRT